MPLVFSTLVVGIAKLGDLKTVGRVGGKSLLWFVTASLISLTLGMLLVNYFQPGFGINLGNANADAAKDLIGKTEGFSIQKFVEHVFPKSVFEAMATNEILQLVVFSIFFGIATAALGDYPTPHFLPVAHELCFPSQPARNDGRGRQNGRATHLG